MTRVGVAGLWHETNTFAASRTGLADFERWQLQRGADVLEAHRDVRDEVGGFCAGLEQWGAEVSPWLYAAAIPSGPVERDVYDSLVTDLLDRLEPDVDGVLLALHGAMAVDGLDDPEMLLVRRIREGLPSGTPIVATLDFHANPSRELFDAADVLIGYDTYPHVDAYERGEEAAELLGRMLQSERLPHKAFRKLPLLTAPPAQATASGPMSEVMARVHLCEQDADIATVTFSGGFAFCDVPYIGSTVLAYSWDEPAAAERAADAVATAAWQRRAQFAIDLVPASVAVRTAMQPTDGPVVLVDASDNIGGGSPGDGTVLLVELLKQGASDALVPIVDPAAVEVAVAAGVGARARITVGGRTDRMHGDPVELTGQVLGIFDGRYRHEGSYMTGQEVDMGRTALVRCGGVMVAIAERRVMPFDAAQLRVLGVDPAALSVLVVKSAVAWRAAYGGIAAAAVLVDTPGVCASDLASLPYGRAPRPIVPLDADA